MQLFREVRNQYTQSVRKAKASFFKQKFARCTVFPPTHWCVWLPGWMRAVLRSSAAWLGCISEVKKNKKIKKRRHPGINGPQWRRCTDNLKWSTYSDGVW